MATTTPSTSLSHTDRTFVDSVPVFKHNLLVAFGIALVMCLMAFII